MSQPAKQAGAAVQKAVKLLHKGEVTVDAVRDALDEVFRGGVPDALVGALLALLRVEICTAEVIAAAADVMRKHAAPADEVDASEAIDIVGTGGDGHNTFNISTASAFVIAGAGAKVVKHGNRAASSTSGSADLLEAIGGHIEQPAKEAQQVLAKSGFCFLFARVFHPGMRFVGPIRAQLGIKSIFNVLGPLTNPARPKRILVGVFSPALGPVYADALKQLGVERAWVVHGEEGLDELSIAGPSRVWDLDRGQVTERRVTPEDAGLPVRSLADCGSGTPAENKAQLDALFAGAEGPIADFIALNAGAALFVAGKAADLKAGVALAQQVMRDGRAAKACAAYAAACEELKPKA